ncbi:hypothetical protein KIN20_017089 [Parelaphostrongylus tenuis]|uniref:Uncharacterized protein n=1 Tax=Parelaphostrongylus tenuis TaxID=148309 RepID=A0AAD5QR83_PARTN|nr:hypothetical protein KIN20_017089 [Parelaphostrongylus tenuis]
MVCFEQAKALGFHQLHSLVKHSSRMRLFCGLEFRDEEWLDCDRVLYELTSFAG